MKVGIETLSAFIAAVLNILHDVRDSLPKFGLEDLGRLWDAIKQAQVLFGIDWKDAVAEARDLTIEETRTLGELVEYKLNEQGIEVENIGLVVARLLEALDAVLDVVDLLHKKA